VQEVARQVAGRDCALRRSLGQSVTLTEAHF